MRSSPSVARAAVSCSSVLLISQVPLDGGDNDNDKKGGTNLHPINKFYYLHTSGRERERERQLLVLSEGGPKRLDSLVLALPELEEPESGVP